MEEIKVGEEEITAEIDKMVGDTPQAEQLRAVFDNENTREMIKRNVVTRQTLEALGEYATTNFVAGVPSDIEDESATDEEPLTDDVSATDEAPDTDASDTEQAEATQDEADD